MESKRLTLPGQWNYEKAYGQADKIARERLAGIDDIEAQCRRSGTEYRVEGDQKSIIVRYLDRPYRISLPGGEIALVDGAAEVPVRDRILILHYFLRAKGTPLSNNLITLRELPEGSGYFPTFFNRTSQPILNHFGKNPALLIDASRGMGGYPADLGDTAVTIKAFTYVPITIVLWRGDDEFPAQGSVLFDATISDYLSTEDIVVLCETITWKLIRYVREMEKPAS
ncbi:MAG: DUF3786 domain-containing protein [Dehalococcoidales bacterium]|nr:DUF3786 domain-containing protein [Dehalococcoidales bacterium]